MTFSQTKNPAWILGGIFFMLQEDSKSDDLRTARGPKVFAESIACVDYHRRESADARVIYVRMLRADDHAITLRNQLIGEFAVIERFTVTNRIRMIESDSRNEWIVIENLRTA